MKTHISTPLYFVMISETIADSAQILTDNMEIIAEVQGKTSKETREIAAGICDAMNEREELLGLLQDALSRLEDWIGTDCECDNTHEADNTMCCLCLYRAAITKARG